MGTYGVGLKNDSSELDYCQGTPLCFIKVKNEPTLEDQYWVQWKSEKSE